ncbi:MAG TPA: general secretion pathway protein GspB [Burkholderiaceae bacterium]|nr:general secretion pathway protein GspB [Burkholderiaceae bacterium]
MSYILDALKKADAERERAGVPGLHALAGGNGAPDEAQRAARRWRAVTLAVLLLGSAAALGWWWHGAGEVSPQAGPAAAPMPAPGAAAMPATAVAPLPPSTLPSPVVVPPAPPVTASPAAGPVAPAAPGQDTAAAAAVPRVIVPPPGAATQAASAAAGTALPVYPDLPADLKRQLPPLAVNGAVYGPAASSRMVFINGQVVREGDSLAEGLVVERIGPKASVLAWRGTRFELRH